MDLPTIALVISGATLLLTFIRDLLNGSWRISTKFSTLQSSLERSIADLKKDIDARSDKGQRETSDAIAAIRQYVHTLELNIEKEFKNYMRRESYYQTNRENNETLKTAFDRIDTRLERMEAKIDQKT